MPVVVEEWGVVRGETVHRVTLVSGDESLRVSVLTYGATVQSVQFRTKDGSGHTEVQLGEDNVGAYVDQPKFFGATVGRFANRLAKARFTIDDVEHRVTANENGNCLHGGGGGLHNVMWSHEVVEDGPNPCVKFRHVSPSQSEGFPGTVDITVLYRVTNDELRIEFDAETDAPTVLNLTNHTYWNLAGYQAGHVDALGHSLVVHADRFTPVNDADYLPTGEIRLVVDTPYDFRGGQILRDGNDAAGPIGYNHYLMFQPDLPTTSAGVHAATLRDPTSGLTMDLHTTQPGLQLYVSGVLPDCVVSGYNVGKNAAVCLECQYPADAPNIPAFGSTTLRPGDHYHHVVAHKFHYT